MELTQEQKQSLRVWVEEGLGLSDIQKRIRSEFGLSMTYMDVRFLVLDLGVAVKDKAVGKSSAKVMDAAEPPQEQAAWGDASGDASAPAAGGVGVDVDKITKPGAVVSGTVTFSDGVSATWFLDQLGRLAINASRPGYRPSEQDLHAFQGELRGALEKRGF